MFSILCDAAATEGAEGGLLGGGMGSILMIVAIFAVFYFFMIRPQSKRQKEMQKMREALAQGDKVVTAGGIHGTIREVGKTYFAIEISKGVTIRVEKTSVYASAEDAEADQQNQQNKQN